MCLPSQNNNAGTLKADVGVLGLSTVAILASTIGLAVKENNAAPAPASPACPPSLPQLQPTSWRSMITPSSWTYNSVCAGAQLAAAKITAPTWKFLLARLVE